MEDRQIIELYWARSETAIAETERKYGPYLRGIACRILSNPEDAKECVNDTYHSAWNAMPPHWPDALSAFLGKITRRISIDRWRKDRAEKRGGGELPLALEELGECVSGGETPEDLLRSKELEDRFHQFLLSLPVVERRVFLRRYWFLDSVGDIADRFGFTQSKVTSMLHRVRNRLRAQLEKEGY